MTETDHGPSPETETLEEVKEAADRLAKRSEVLQALEDEWVVAAGLVSVYENLFFDAERLEVLNLVVGPLLRLTQDVLWEYLLLRVARLTDPPTAGREREKESLSVLWLQRLFGADELEDQQKAKLKVLVEEAKEAAKFARQWRNKRVVHVDLDRARDDVTHIFRGMRPAVAKPLEPATLEEMDRALQAVHRALDTAFKYANIGSIEPAAVTLEIGTKVSERAIRLVEAVQFIDTMADPERGSSLGGEEATEFLEKLGPELVEEVRALGPLRLSRRAGELASRHGGKAR